jgi:hypothetical protein
MEGHLRTRSPHPSDPPLVPMSEAPARFEANGLKRELAALYLYRTLLQSGPVAALENEINMRIVRAGVLTERPEALRLRELAIMRVAWVAPGHLRLGTPPQPDGRP